MGPLRKPFQGIANIIRFNRHFYVLAAAAISTGIIAGNYATGTARFSAHLLCWLVLAPTLLSLIVSLYVYDLSGLYNFAWLAEAGIASDSTLINIHAGFDETSALLQNKYPGAALHVFDCYNPVKHTEISIKRARKAYPPFPGTVATGTTNLPLPDATADVVFLTLAAHEIRDAHERAIFFNELHRVLKPDGKIIVTEHLRNLPNFIAYNIGFFHFLPRRAWVRTFAASGFGIVNERNIATFITSFTLSKYAPAP